MGGRGVGWRFGGGGGGGGTGWEGGLGRGEDKRIIGEKGPGREKVGGAGRTAIVPFFGSTCTYANASANET